MSLTVAKFLQTFLPLTLSHFLLWLFIFTCLIWEQFLLLKVQTKKKLLTTSNLKLEIRPNFHSELVSKGFTSVVYSNAFACNHKISPPHGLTHPFTEIEHTRKLWRHINTQSQDVCIPPHARKSSGFI